MTTRWPSDLSTRRASLKDLRKHGFVEIRIVLDPVWLMHPPYDDFLILILQTVRLLRFRSEQIRLNIEQRLSSATHERGLMRPHTRSCRSRAGLVITTSTEASRSGRAVADAL